MAETKDIIAAVQSAHGTAILEEQSEIFQPWLKVKPENIVEACVFLKNDTKLKFDFLRMIAGIHYDSEIELSYLLFSYEYRHEFKIKTRVPIENPVISTVESVWPAANWHEREIYDLLGVQFENHSDLRRLLLPDDWIGHPLRKDYKERDQYNGVATTRHYLTGMPELPTHPPIPSDSEAGT